MTREEAQSLLAGGGEMGERIRAFDWSTTPLGPRETWSPALRTTLGLLLANRFPLLLWWGPEYISIYNDAYAPILGRKHPKALGQPVRECWSEIWDILKPLIDTPFDGGASTWIEDFELQLQRSGFTEEGHFTVAYSPVPDDTVPHGIGGVLATVHEITQKVVAERRGLVLRDLGLQVAESSAEETCRAAAETLACHSKDVPFALLYLLDLDGRHARLAGAAGIEPGLGASPLLVSLEPAAEPEQAWPLAAAVRSQAMVTVTDLRARFDVPAGPWVDAPHSAVVVPVRSNKAGELAGLLVAGVSARLAFDELYRDFYELVASRIANAIANARAYEEERKRAEMLAAIDRAKTAFFSNVSHEFRTPLTLMLGPLDDLKRELGAGAARSASHYGQVELIHRNGLRLLKLVNTLLDFSRIEAGRIQASYQPTDLAEYTAELASVFRAAIEKAGLNLTIDCPPLSEPAFVDREMWEKIVLNLVSNAFKFTFEGEIEVSLRASGSQIELTVRDTGTGIPPDEVPKLFERFHRVAGARGRTHEGSGIGLALVQELARLHGGSVTATSTYGAGSVFRVSIPVGHGHLPPAQVGSARTQASTALGARPFVEEALRWLPDAGSENEPVIQDVAMPLQGQTPDGARPRILLADDNADMRDYVRKLLSQRYEVEAAADGEAALAAIEHRAPDLVLADIMMPRLDGFGLLARLRADTRTSTLPIILLSARAGEEAKVEGLAAGADDYLIKPFSARELMAYIEANLNLKRLREQSQQDLRESEERFRNMADAAPVMVWVTEPDTSASYLSRSWYAFTGQTPQSGLGFGWLDAMHPDDRPAVRDAFAAANEKRETFRSEYRLRRSDGEYRWVIDAAAPRFGQSGKFLGYIGSVFDITERKLAEQTQQLLVGELNHRVKNMLASVQAMVQHTLRRSKDPAEFEANFAGRIQSLSRVHSLLSNTTWRGADLRELIRDQLLLGAVDETRLTARGPAVQLAPQTTLHMALMMHELGTNAIKYGALSGATGHVTISWTVDGGVLNLRWLERGGPLAAAPTTRGFGMSLIEQSAKSEGGGARMSVEADGIVWEIGLPLPRPAGSDARQRLPAAAGLAGGVPPEARALDRAAAKLAGRRILVIEDEPLVALDLIAGLEEAGAEVMGPAGTPKEALGIIDGTPLDGALLDANLHGRSVDEIAAALTRRNTPFIFVSGYGRESLPRAFGKVAILAKPFTRQQLLEAATRLLRPTGDVARLKP